MILGGVETAVLRQQAREIRLVLFQRAGVLRLEELAHARREPDGTVRNQAGGPRGYGEETPEAVGLLVAQDGARRDANRDLRALLREKPLDALDAPNLAFDLVTDVASVGRDLLEAKEDG